VSVLFIPLEVLRLTLKAEEVSLCDELDTAPKSVAVHKEVSKLLSLKLSDAAQVAKVAVGVAVGVLVKVCV